MGLKDYSCLMAVGSSWAMLPIGHSHEPLLFKGTVGGDSRLLPPAGPYSAQTTRQQTFEMQWKRRVSAAPHQRVDKSWACPHPLIPLHVILGFRPRNLSVSLSFFLSRGVFFFWMWGLPWSAEGMIRMRRAGIKPQMLAIKEYPHGDKEKESRTHHGFYKLVMVLLWFPAAENIYCEGNSK